MILPAGRCREANDGRSLCFGVSPRRPWLVAKESLWRQDTTSVHSSLLQAASSKHFLCVGCLDEPNFQSTTSFFFKQLLSLHKLEQSSTTRHPQHRATASDALSFSRFLLHHSNRACPPGRPSRFSQPGHHHRQTSVRQALPLLLLMLSRT